VYDNENIEYENVNEPDEEQTEQENYNEYGNEIELQMIPEQGDIETEPSEAEDTSNDFENEMNERYGICGENYDLLPRRPRDYSHLHTTLESIIMTQHSMKKVIKLLREAGIDAVLQELQQLHDREVIKPKNASELSGSDKEGALQYLMFLRKQKRNGTIKGRGCADEKKRDYTSKEESSSPTVAIWCSVARLLVLL